MTSTEGRHQLRYICMARALWHRGNPKPRHSTSIVCLPPSPSLASIQRSSSNMSPPIIAGMMHKLRKRSPPPLYRAETEPSGPWMAGMQNPISPGVKSKTMALAMSTSTAPLDQSPALPGYLRPCSPAEQYWAARALTAETLLAAKTDHQRELKDVAYTEDVKRVVRRMSLHVSRSTNNCRSHPAGNGSFEKTA